MNVTEIALLELGDPSYTRWARRHRLSSQTGREPCPFARDYQRALHKWEKIVQSLLKLGLEEYPNRILCWKQKDKWRRLTTRYRELDYVHGNNQTPKLFIEIKHREKTTSGSSGRSQVTAALAVAQKRWPALGGICLNVYMATVLGLKCDEQPPLASIDSLSEQILFKSLRTDDIPILWIDGMDVAKFAISTGLLEEDEVLYLPSLRQFANDPLSSIRPEEGKSDGNQLRDFWTK